MIVQKEYGMMRYGLAGMVMAACFSVPAYAAPLTFDCNAPGDDAAAIENIAQMPPAISGTITPNRSRPGRFTVSKLRFSD